MDFLGLILFSATLLRVASQDNDCNPIYVRWPRVRLNLTSRVTGPYSQEDCAAACSKDEHPGRSGYPLQCSGFNHKHGASNLANDCQLFQKDQVTSLDGNVEYDDRYSFYWKYCVKAKEPCKSVYQYDFHIDRYMDYSESKRRILTFQIEDCLDECSKEKSFECRSVSFNRTAGYCYLSGESRLSKPSSVRINSNPNYRIDYYENKCHNDCFTFHHDCQENGVMVSVDAKFPYTGAMYGLYDFFSCRIEPKEEKKFQYFFPFPAVSKNCSDSITVRDGDYVLEVVLSTDNVIPLYFLTDEDLIYKATCPLDPKVHNSASTIGAQVELVPPFSKVEAVSRVALDPTSSTSFPASASIAHASSTGTTTTEDDWGWVDPTETTTNVRSSSGPSSTSAAPHTSTLSSTSAATRHSSTTASTSTTSRAPKTSGSGSASTTTGKPATRAFGHDQKKPVDILPSLDSQPEVAKPEEKKGNKITLFVRYPEHSNETVLTKVNGTSVSVSEGTLASTGSAGAASNSSSISTTTGHTSSSVPSTSTTGHTFRSASSSASTPKTTAGKSEETTATDNTSSTISSSTSTSVSTVSSTAGYSRTWTTSNRTTSSVQSSSSESYHSSSTEDTTSATKKSTRKPSTDVGTTESTTKATLSDRSSTEESTRSPSSTSTSPSTVTSESTSASSSSSRTTVGTSSTSSAGSSTSTTTSTAPVTTTTSASSSASTDVSSPETTPDFESSTSSTDTPSTRSSTEARSTFAIPFKTDEDDDTTTVPEDQTTSASSPPTPTTAPSTASSWLYAWRFQLLSSTSTPQPLYTSTDRTSPTQSSTAAPIGSRKGVPESAFSIDEYDPRVGEPKDAQPRNISSATTSSSTSSSTSTSPSSASTTTSSSSTTISTTTSTPTSSSSSSSTTETSTATTTKGTSTSISQSGPSWPFLLRSTESTTGNRFGDWTSGTISTASRPTTISTTSLDSNQSTPATSGTSQGFNVSAGSLEANQTVAAGASSSTLQPPATSSSGPPRKILFDVFHNGQPVSAVVVGSRISLSFLPSMSVPGNYMTLVACQVEPVNSPYAWERDPLQIVRNGCQADGVGLVCPPQYTEAGVKVEMEAFRYTTTAEVLYSCLARVCPYGPCPQPLCTAVDGCNGQRRAPGLAISPAFPNDPSIALGRRKRQQTTLPILSFLPVNADFQQNLITLAGDHVVSKKLVVVNSETELQYYLRTGNVPSGTNNVNSFLGR